MSTFLQQKCDQDGTSTIGKRKFAYSDLKRNRYVSASVSVEKLIIESLENQSEELKSPIVRYRLGPRARALQCALTGKVGVLENVAEQKDFTVYGGEDVKSFFNNSRNRSSPKKVSDVCLINDNYIFVKVPESYQQKHFPDRTHSVFLPKPEEPEREEFKEPTKFSSIGTDNPKKDNMSKYLPCNRNRNRRVTPTTQPTPDFSSNETKTEEPKKKPQPPKKPIKKESQQWGVPEEREVYNTCTKVITFLHKKTDTKSKNATDQLSEKIVSGPEQSHPLDLSLRSIRSRSSADQEITSISRLNLNTDTLSPFKCLKNTFEEDTFGTSLHNLIDLEQHGSLETPIRKKSISRKHSLIPLYSKLNLNSGKSSPFKCSDSKFDQQSIGTSLHNLIDLEENGTLETPSRKKTIGRKRSMEVKPIRQQFSAMRWLMRQFRTRQKLSKPQQKIQAVIYKTYFVRWEKPPEVSHNGYQVRRRSIDCHEEITLRRSRSAIF